MAVTGEDSPVCAALSIIMPRPPFLSWTGRGSSAYGVGSAVGRIFGGWPAGVPAPPSVPLVHCCSQRRPHGRRGCPPVVGWREQLQLAGALGRSSGLVHAGPPALIGGCCGTGLVGSWWASRPLSPDRRQETSAATGRSRCSWSPWNRRGTRACFTLFGLDQLGTRDQPGTAQRHASTGDCTRLAPRRRLHLPDRRAPARHI